MTVFVCPGSYDPITFGHVDVIARCASLADTVILAIANNAEKCYLFTAEERAELARDAVSHLSNVRVDIVEGLMVERYKSFNPVIVKGVRGPSDFQHEAIQSTVNREISGFETFYLPATPSLSHISSSIVKELGHYGVDLSEFTTERVAQALAMKLNQQ
ncbi:pantetheine-phosphate adenylyltransferase [Boudabousia marimammalium]|uniref:Phosphopantetheine adenylyltransferase n=1 Tax=Boudabousia marimammalium TaxID=156892 RepID=A0A1Q5PRT1_9ACTO|nr:pantetheine-phosphate adenylyltransferase [Boudabousia marimammalium]OKL50120.1 pantetheine-phosphate adenylyltransferase [Boudabousia marimammalium]